ncbi:MAG: AI-2E family transporter [Clostridiales bacterium]
MILPSLAEQSRLFLIYIPDLAAYLMKHWFDLLNAMERISLPDSLFIAIDHAAGKLEQLMSDRLTELALKIPTFLKIALYTILAPFLSYYLLRDKSLIKKKLITLISAKNRPEFLRLAGDVDHLLRQFICGYVLVSVVVAVITGLFLYIIGVEYAVVLGLLMGIADLIPYFGPILGAIPAVLVALAASPKLAAIALIGLLIIQQLEGLVITPLIMGDRIGMHPLITIFVVLIGGYLCGVLGAILAVPVAASLNLICRYLYSRVVEYQENL